MEPWNPTLRKERDALAARWMYTSPPKDWAPGYRERIVRKSATELDSSLLVSTEPIMAFFHRTLFRGHVWPLGLAAFGLYYGGSFVAAWLAGTLYSVGMLKPATDPLAFTSWLSWLALFEAPQKGNFVPLLADFTHLNFAVLVCLIAYPLGYQFVQSIPREFQTFFDSGVPEVEPAWVSNFLSRLKRSVGRRFNVVLASAFGILSGCTFIVLARSGVPATRRWWGHAEFGFAGYYLAFVQALCCYYAMWGFQLFLVLNRHIRDATERVRVFHPFHQDGYYGLQPLARLLAWQATLVLLGGVALFSTYYIGYFGLENSLLILISMLVFTVGTGAGLAWPLYVMTLHVRHLREDAIKAIEPQMQHMIHGLANVGGGAPIAMCRDELAPLMPLYTTLRTCRTIPFGLASLNTVIFGYLLQSAVLVRQFYAHFR
jgi:hypothetical protein